MTFAVVIMSKIRTLYSRYTQLILVLTNHTEYPQPCLISSYKRPLSSKHRAALTSKCSFYQKPDNYLTVTKIKWIWGKYIYVEAIQITSSSGIYKTNIYDNDCYLQLFVFKFHMDNSSSLEMNASLFFAFFRYLYQGSLQTLTIKLTIKQQM